MKDWARRAGGSSLAPPLRRALAGLVLFASVVAALPAGAGGASSSAQASKAL